MFTNFISAKLIKKTKINKYCFQFFNEGMKS